MARDIHPAPYDVSVRCDPEGAREGSYEVTGMSTQDPAGLCEGEGLGQPLVQEDSQPVRQGIVSDVTSGIDPEECPRQRVAQCRQVRLGLQLVSRRPQRRVYATHRRRGSPRRHRPVGRRSRELRREPVRVGVQNALAKEGSFRGGTPIMRYLRREQGECPRSRDAIGSSQAIADRAFVHEEQRPRVVGVRRVGVVPERRVEDLAQSRHRRVRGAHRVSHVKNVQDGAECRRDDEVMPEPSSDAALLGDGIVRFDTKVALALREDLLPWQELNVTAFLMTGIATSAEGLVGEPYEDADGETYLPLLRQPVVVYAAPIDVLARAREKAIERRMATAIYTREMFATGHDGANRAAVRVVPSADLDLVGVAVRGPRNAVDRIFKGARMHD